MIMEKNDENKNLRTYECPEVEQVEFKVESLICGMESGTDGGEDNW